MNIEYKWTVSNTQHYTNPSEKEGIISNVVWTCTATDTDSGYVDSVTNVATLPLPTSNILPFESVTEEDVLSWIFSVGNVDKIGIESFLEQKLLDAQVWSKPWVETADISNSV